jgi:hypothetical protein
MQVNHIYASIHGQDSESLIIKHDIYNERANVCRDKFGGLFPIYALFRFVLISDKAHKEFTSAFECENGDKGGPLKYLFVMYNKHIRFLKANFEIFIADAIYKINRFNMSLFNIVGMALNNMSFFAASAFFFSEADVDFEWALQKLKDVYDAQKLFYPKVILTDADGALARAITKIFLIIAYLFYIWHVNKNIEK